MTELSLEADFTQETTPNHWLEEEFSVKKQN